MRARLKQRTEWFNVFSYSHTNKMKSKLFKYFAITALMTMLDSMSSVVCAVEVTIDSLTYELTISSDLYNIEKVAILIGCAKKGDHSSS